MPDSGLRVLLALFHLILCVCVYRCVCVVRMLNEQSTLLNKIFSAQYVFILIFMALFSSLLYKKSYVSLCSKEWRVLRLGPKRHESDGACPSTLPLRARAGEATRGALDHCSGVQPFSRPPPPGPGMGRKQCWFPPPPSPRDCS